MDKNTAWILAQRQADAWMSLDLERIASEFSLDAQFTHPRCHSRGREGMRQASRMLLKDLVAIRISVRRVLCDGDWAFGEWVWREAAESSGCGTEFEQGFLFQALNGQVTFWRTSFNTVGGRAVHLDDPLPADPWPACCNGHCSEERHGVLAALQRHRDCWLSGDAERVAGCYAENGRIVAPWAFVNGPDEVLQAAREYHSKFSKPKIEWKQLLIDDHHIALQQMWQCTRQETSEVGIDDDLIFGVVLNGKIAYWRNFADASKSVQRLDFTV